MWKVSQCPRILESTPSSSCCSFAPCQQGAAQRPRACCRKCQCPVLSHTTYQHENQLHFCLSEQVSLFWRGFEVRHPSFPISMQKKKSRQINCLLRFAQKPRQLLQNLQLASVDKAIIVVYSIFSFMEYVRKKINNLNWTSPDKHNVKPLARNPILPIAKEKTGNSPAGLIQDKGHLQLYELEYFGKERCFQFLLVHLLKSKHHCLK